MQFELDSEQDLLRDSVARWVEKNYTFAKRQKVRALPNGYSRDHWKEIAELGWLGVALPEDAGGLGQSTIESCIIAEQLGRGLTLEPYVSVSVLAAHLLEQGATPAQREEWLPALIGGEKLFAVAHNEHEADGALSYVATKAEKTKDGWKLSGQKTFVLEGEGTDLLLVSARTGGKVDDQAGISLFVVDPKAASITRRDYRRVDGGHASDFVFDGTALPADAVVGKVGEAYSAIEYAHDRAIIVLCAEAVGMIDQALQMTCEYLRTRKQFGVFIGTFQVLQHRIADMYIETQVARAALWRALALLNGDDDRARRRAIATVKARVGQAARYVCGQAVQLHGGIAITEEFPIGHYFKRMTVFDLTFGNAQIHLMKIARDISRPTN